MHVSELIISVLWIVFIGYWIISAVGVKRSISRPWHWLGLRVVFIVVFIALLESKTFDRLDASASGFSSNPWVAGLGVVLTAAGIGFAIWARAHLGTNWGMPMSVKEDSELVTSGPYTYVRHPIYSGALLAMLGTALTIGLWWFVPFAFFGAYFIFSATQEEKRMMREFPDQYPDYKKGTTMLVPFIF